jgi:hypothetical protein
MLWALSPSAHHYSVILKLVTKDLYEEYSINTRKAQMNQKKTSKCIAFNATYGKNMKVEIRIIEYLLFANADAGITRIN